MSHPPYGRRALSLAFLACAVLSTSTTTAAQSGLRGEYFDSSTPPPLGSAASFERLDPRIDFTWTGDAPDGTTLQPDDSYSERWTGYVHVSSGGLWSFSVISNDGARLWIDGVLVVDDWSPHFTRELTGSLALPAAGWYPLRLEHYNAGGTAAIRVAFEGPTQPKVIIPTAALCPDDDCTRGLSVDLGPDRRLLPPETSLELAATVRGPQILHFPGTLAMQWTQVAGPPALITDPDRIRTEIVPSESGVLRFRLTVVDPLAGSASDEVTVAVFDEGNEAELTGELRKWHKLALTFRHNAILSETGLPNPFLDLRLETLFLHPVSGALYSVPGFFAADGDAAETSATSGDRWRVNFVPDRAGTWHYLARFRGEPGIALSLDSEAGAPLSFDGTSGSFVVAPADPNARGFHSQGRLEYVGGHHLRFAETRAHFLKSGTNSPENFLGYYEFDNTYDLGGQPNALINSGYRDGLHHFDPHFGDYLDRGVPTWQGGKGRRIFGAIDYLAANGVNSLYALTYNIDGGDGREVWPWVDPADKLRFDVSKLAQWERLVDHMMRAGVALHLMTQETENEFVLDGGELGTQRKLYYRELVARFGHALALSWNLGEENDNTTAQRRAFAEHIRALDPYDHPIALHNHSGDTATFDELLGSHLELVAWQGLPADTAMDTQQLVDDSAGSGRPWVVNCDELGPADDGVVPDSVDYWHDSVRKLALWPNLMGQGGGSEWYFGYAYPHDDLDCEDFRSRANMWRLASQAVQFMRDNLPFAEMEHADYLVAGSSPRTLAKRGEIYAIYLPNGGNPFLNLELSTETFLVRWFDARNGGPLQTSSVASVHGPSFVSLGPPPGAGDWLAFVRRAENLAPAITGVKLEPQPFQGRGDLSIQVHAADGNGPVDRLAVSVQVLDANGDFFGSFLAPHRGGSLHSILFKDLAPLPSGEWRLWIQVLDPGGLSAVREVRLRVP